MAASCIWKLRRAHILTVVGRHVPGESVPSFQRGKLYDLLAATPLTIWYCLAVVGIVPRIAEHFRQYIASNDTSSGLTAVTMLVTLVFIAIQIFLFIIRRPPEEFSRGVLPRLAAVAGANSGLALLLLPQANMPLGVEALSAALIVFGSLAAIAVACWLGRSFSILPQARALVVSGPYRYVRHPLYAAEQIAAFGVMLQFQQPWSFAIVMLSFALQFSRMHYEEQVLSHAYPEYQAYKIRTARLIPGVY